MYDYGNARIAALRSRLLEPPELRRLAGLDTPEAVLTLLQRSADWRVILRDTAPLFSDPQAAIETSIERHRSTRLGALVHWYDGAAGRLVEALVIHLDLERVVAIMRRRRGGAPAGDIGASIVAGALLDVSTLGSIARTSGDTELGRTLVRAGVLSDATARALGANGLPAGRGLEERLVAAFDDAQSTRASGRGRDARTVQAILAEERTERALVISELRDEGPATAWLMERSLTLERLDRVAHAGARDPLGIGAAAGYVAAVEAQAIRMRACLARVVAGWGSETLASFLPRMRG